MRKAIRLNEQKIGKPGEHKFTDMYAYGNYKVVYEYDSRSLDPAHPRCYSCFDVVRIYEGDTEIISHKPRLDSYLNAREHIVVVTSDGQCWVYDLLQHKQSLIRMPIVPFDCAATFDRSEFTYRIKNAFMIYGSGCAWGCESEEQFFELYVDKDTLELVKSSYVFDTDDDDEEDDEPDDVPSDADIEEDDN